MKRSVNEYDAGRGGGLRKAAEIGAFTAGGAGLMAGPIKVASLTGQKVAEDKQNKADREAKAEIKRESRGVEKPANFDAIEEAKQEAKDAADRKKQDKAYNESLTTENKAKGGMTAKFMSFSKKGKPAGMKSVTKMASGGSASSRADGCCTKVKTRGKMV